MSGPFARFKNVSVGWGRRAVLTGVDLELPRRSFIGILGYNGSGKTTLIKTLLGLIPPLKGRIEYDGIGPGSARFGYVPQKERLDPIYPLSAFAVAAMGAHRRLELFARLRGLDRRPLVEKSLAACGATQLAARRYSDLSGGQRQRVLISRALAAEPEILVLDEPLAGIDITTQRSLIELLKRLKEERRLSVLMVSHRVQAERGLFTHIVWCDEGKAVMGTAEEMLSSRRIHDIFGGDL